MFVFDRSKWKQFTIVLLLPLLFSNVCSSQATTSNGTLMFRVGAAMGFGQNDSLACHDGEAGMFAGYVYAINWINTISPLYAVDITGTSYRILFDATFYKQSYCNMTQRAADIDRLVRVDKVHLLLGGNSRWGVNESLIVNSAQRIMHYCCASADEIYDLDIAWVYGTFVSSSFYTQPVLNAMATRGIQRIAMASVNVIPYFGFCGSAVDYLPRLNDVYGSNVQVVYNSNYTEADTRNLTRWAERMVETMMHSNPDSIMLCDGIPERAIAFTRAFRKSGMYVKALWIAVAPTRPEFAQQLGPLAEYVLSTTQWHQSMRYKGSYFGTPLQFYNTYANQTNLEATYLTAGASATMVLIAQAIQATFSRCNFSTAEGDVDRMLRDPKAISCPGLTGILASIPRLTGYDVLRSALEQTSTETFFGPVEFNSKRRNIAFRPPVLQIVGGVAQTVLPSDAATTPLVMPIPLPPKKGPWTDKPRNVILLTVAVCFGFMFTVMIAACCVWRRMHMGGMPVVAAVTVPRDQVKVLLELSWVRGKLAYEPGEGTYKGSRVMLIPALELTPKASMKAPKRTTTAAAAAASAAANSGVSLSRRSTQQGNSGGSSLTDDALTHDTQLTVDPEARKISRLDENARKAAAAVVWRAMRLQHSGLGPVLGVVWEWPGLQAPVLLRELCDLGSLASLLDNITVPLSWHVKSQIASQIASTMHYLHSQDPPIYVPMLSCDIIMIDAHFMPRLALPLECITDPPAQPSPSGIYGGFGVLPTRRREPPGQTTVDSGSGTRRMDSNGNINPHVEQDMAMYGVLLCQLFGSGAAILGDPATRHTSDGKVEQLLPAMHQTLPSLANFIRRCLPPAPADPDDTIHVDDLLGQSGVSFDSFEELGAELAVLLGQLQQDAEPHRHSGLRSHRSVHARKTSAESSVDIQQEEQANRLGGLRQHRRARKMSSQEVTPIERAPTSGSVDSSEAAHSERPSDQLSHASVPKPTALTGNYDDLIYEIFPPQVARALQRGQEVQPERHELVSIFFSDIVGYTDICAQMQPHEVMDMLHRLYTTLDGLVRKYCLFKVETIGDAYMAVANLRWPLPETHTMLLTQFALAAIEAANSIPVHPAIPELGCVNIRVGLHCGPVIASVVGTLNRRYCLFGDTVNTASRMESNSEQNRVHASAVFADLLAKQWPDAVLTPRGTINIKGKGLMETYWISDQPGRASSMRDSKACPAPL